MRRAGAERRASISNSDASKLGRRQSQHPRRGGDRHLRRASRGEGGQAGVGDHHALRRAGRARRVDHVRDVVRGQRRVRSPSATGASGSPRPRRRRARATRRARQPSRTRGDRQAQHRTGIGRACARSARPAAPGPPARTPPPVLATAHIATTDSTDRGNASATNDSGPTPREISSRARRFDGASSSRVGHRRCPRTSARPSPGRAPRRASGSPATAAAGYGAAIARSASTARSPPSIRSTSPTRTDGSAETEPSTRTSRSTNRSRGAAVEQVRRVGHRARQAVLAPRGRSAPGRSSRRRSPASSIVTRTPGSSSEPTPGSAATAPPGTAANAPATRGGSAPRRPARTARRHAPNAARSTPRVWASRSSKVSVGSTSVRSTRVLTNMPDHVVQRRLAAAGDRRCRRRCRAGAAEPRELHARAPRAGP